VLTVVLEVDLALEQHEQQRSGLAFEEDRLAGLERLGVGADGQEVDELGHGRLVSWVVRGVA
jgi:hypothetical protein